MKEIQSPFVNSMNPYFKPIPLGESIPLNNPHAVSVSLPTIADVIGYEENKPEVLNKMQSGYPRFFTNKLVEKLCDYVRKNYNISETKELIPLMDDKAFNILQKKFEENFDYLEEAGSIFLVIESKNTHLQAIKDFIRHTGLLLSSRKAEDILFSLGLLTEKFQEYRFKEKESTHLIKNTLQQAYAANSADDVFLYSSGMNAVYSAFEALQSFNQNTEKQTIIQAGWLYLDTLEIIKKYSKNCIILNQVTGLTQLEDLILKESKNIGAVFTEIPNNPLLQCVDLPRLYKLCKSNNIPLLVDSTIGTAYTMNVLAHCDVAIESLTKFACGKGDVLMGAVIINAKSPFASAFKNKLETAMVSPYLADASRLAFSIGNYEERVKKVIENTREILTYLSESEAVETVYSVLHPDSADNFNKIKKHENDLAGLISVVFKKDLSQHYDTLNLPKGPSLGTEFTLAMPYVYLAHYDMVKTEEGRNSLKKMGLHPELLRISIGTEEVSEIISVLKAAGI